MKFVYAPKGAEPREWELSGDDLTVAEVLQLEDTLNMTMMEIAAAENRGSATVVLRMWWLARRREEPSLKFSDLRDVRTSDLAVTYADEAEAEDEAPGDGAPKDEPGDEAKTDG